MYPHPHADKHLTNVAINMYAPTYVKRIGGKWFLDNLKNFMLSKYHTPHPGSVSRRPTIPSQISSEPLSSLSRLYRNW